MLGRWLLRRAVARVAVAGLAIGLGALAMLIIWSTIKIHDATERVRAFNEVSAHWNSVFTHVSAEDMIVRDFVAAGGAEQRRDPLIAMIGSAEPDLTWLETHGGVAEAAYVRKLRPWYSNYTRLIRTIVDSAANHRLAGYGNLAMLDFATLRDQIVANVERKQRELTHYLVQVDRANTTLRWVAGTVVMIDLVLYSVSALVLVSYQRGAEREAARNRHDALHDSLTGLANRQLLAERSEQAISEARANSGLACLLFIDLDRFKEVNDTLGHHCGDQLLMKIASRLSDVARQSDVVARLGGDEFAILMSAVDSSRDVPPIAERVRVAVEQPVDLGGSQVSVGASIGVAAFPVDCDNVEDLLRHADVAMYVAKRGGLGVSIYDPERDDHNPAADPTLGQLRHGITNGELELHFQPKVDAETLQVHGVEALVRWRHPTRGLLCPNDFIPHMERSDLVETLTDEVLGMAVRQARHWLDHGRRLSVSVNVPARSMLNAAFVEKVTKLLATHGVPPDILTLELTDSASIRDHVRAADVVGRLWTLGVRISIDRFGTSDSPMASLLDLPVHEVKIDRGLVMTMRDDGPRCAIIGAIIGVVGGMDLDIVAVGVPDAVTLALIRSLGCSIIQGNHICPPLPPAELDAWLDRPAALTRAG